MYRSDANWMMPSGNWAMSYGPSSNINPDLGWEEKHEFNVGLDYALLNNRIYGSFDYYRRNVKDLIYNVEVPQPPYTESSMYKNIGQLENKGWELVVGADVVRSEKCTYSTSLNLSHNKTVMGKMNGNNTYINGGYVNDNNWVQYAHRLQEGVEVGSFFLYRHVGIADDGRMLVYDKDNNIIYASEAREDDRVYQKNYTPKIMAGWTHNLTYKKWDLSTTLTSWINFDIYNGVEIEYGLRDATKGNMLYDAIGKNNAITGTPAPSSYFIYDGTFLKIQNLTLGYRFNLNKATKLFDTARLYLTGNNLYTFTKYPGLNPQIGITGWQGGVESAKGIYPQTKTLTMGLQLNF